MALTPQQAQLLQSYMMKNRAPAPQGQQAQQFQAKDQTGGGLDSSSLLSALSKIGGWMDTPAMHGPVQPGEAPLPGAQQSWLTQYVNRVDPAAAQQRAQESMPPLGREDVMTILKKAGVI